MRNQILLLLAIVGLVSATPAFAAPAACAAGTYASYIGTSCSINGLIFDDFTFQSTSQPGNNVIPATGISVTPITTLGNEGFQFNLGSSVSSNGTSHFQDEVLLFHISTADKTPTIQDLTLFFNGSFTGTGMTNVTENYCLNSDTFIGCSKDGSGQIKVTNPPPSFNDKVLLAGSGVSSLYVAKDINVTSGANGTAYISIVSNTFTHGAVPEPWSMVLVGSGLVGLGLLRRYRKN